MKVLNSSLGINPVKLTKMAQLSQKRRVIVAKTKMTVIQTKDLYAFRDEIRKLKNPKILEDGGQPDITRDRCGDICMVHALVEYEVDEKGSDKA